MINSTEIVRTAYRALDEKKGVNIKIIDIRDISVVADYFLIAGASNQNQIRALTDNVEEKLSEAGCNVSHIEGYSSANWILMDYKDVIVHVFNEEDRLFYDLERIWQDGKTIDINEL